LHKHLFIWSAKLRIIAQNLAFVCTCSAIPKLEKGIFFEFVKTIGAKYRIADGFSHPLVYLLRIL
jgi:hypothetical protein